MEENKENEKVVKNEVTSTTAKNVTSKRSSTEVNPKNTKDFKAKNTTEVKSKNVAQVGPKSTIGDKPKTAGVEKSTDRSTNYNNSTTKKFETSNANKVEIKHEPVTESRHESSYKPVGEFNFEKKKKHFSFGRSIFLPFLSGILGTAVVVGVCFGVPTIKDKVMDFLNITSNSTANDNFYNDNNSSSGAPSISLEEYSATSTAVAKIIRPSIVGINVEYSVNSIFYRTTSQTATVQGSGIIISEDGYILTNSHVVNATSSSTFYVLEEASKVTVYLSDDDTAYEARIIGTDDQTDLAIIKIDKTGLTAAKLGDSDKVQVGEFAMAIGNPLGMENSVSAGIISATNRKITSDGKTFTLIQTDAAINSGNSGGALVNSKGEVIGVNTLKMQGSGVEAMGFAIPINSTKDVSEQLIQYSKVKRPYIGITGINVTESMAKQYNLVIGVYVKSIDDFSSAQKADIRIGDVIIEFDGQKVTTMDEITEIKNNHKIGDELKLKVNRNGEEKELTLILQEQ